MTTDDMIEQYLELFGVAHLTKDEARKALRLMIENAEVSGGIKGIKMLEKRMAEVKP
jgi:hypothetical protein